MMNDYDIASCSPGGDYAGRREASFMFRRRRHSHAPADDAF